MSSNPLHITRSNYEEFFLLYVDGELSPEQCDAVEAFSALHPDLQEELDMLLSTRLDAETISFEKESLMSDSMKNNAIDEDLFLYIDNELEGSKKADMDARLANDPIYQYQHQLLLQTKLPAEPMVYPHKQELYRRTTPAIRPVVWFRVAAAIFVIMAMSFMWWMSQDLTTSAPVAVQEPKAVIPSSKGMTTTSPQSSIVSANSQEDVIMEDAENAAIVTVVTNKNNQAYTVASSSIEPATTTPAHQPDAQNTIAAIDVDRVENIDQPQQIINRPSVTTSTVVAYNAIETATNRPAEDEVAAIENNEKRGSVKGFLRKATRLIERRTGINPTNDDEELLIGAMAIKLK